MLCLHMLTSLNKLLEVELHVGVADHLRAALYRIENDPLPTKFAHREPMLVKIADVRLAHSE